MFERLPSRRFGWRQSTASVLLHAAVLVALLGGYHSSPVRVLLPGTMKGSRIDLTYYPGRAPVPTMKKDVQKTTPQSAPPLLKQSLAAPAPVPDAALADLAHPHLPPMRQSSPTTDMAPSPAPEDAAGTDSFGNGDVQIALTMYSPSPRPDLSSLPRGTQGDVIVDVTIDPTGRVADLQVLRALGYGIDNNVMETVRTWKFHPALKDGVAVASVQELHFHFGPVR